MADLDLEELARLEKAATPGPWRWLTDDERRKMSISEPTGWLVGPTSNVLDYAGCGSHDYEASKEDKAFLVALRNAAPALLAAAREGADRLDLLHECWEQWAYEAQEKGWMFAGGLSTLESLADTLVKAGRLEEHPKGGMYRAALAGKGGGNG